jgi:hypothetical protein
MAILLTLLALVGLGPGLAPQPTHAATASRATLRVVATQPLAIRGKGFSARERIRVTATTGGTRTRRLRATQTGTFTATFADLSYDRCVNGLVVTARGRTRSAMLKLPQAECPVP